MYRKVTAITARRNLGKLLEEVSDKSDHVVITRHNKAMVAMIPAEDYERFLVQRMDDGAVIDEIRGVVMGDDPEIVEREVVAAIARVRAKKKPHDAQSRS